MNSTSLRVGGAVVVGHALFVLFFLAALGKLLGFPEFVTSLGRWGLPRQSAGSHLLALAVILYEFNLVMEWFFGNRLRAILLAQFFLVSVLLLAWYWNVVSGLPPDCSCFGMIQRYLSIADDSRSLMARDAVLLLVTSAIALVFRAAGSRSCARETNGRT